MESKEAQPARRGPEPPHNLPVALSTFIGRERDITEVRRLLLEDKNRLLTLTGPGGCGKTRLALAAAHELVGDFEEGVWWVELAPLSDPDLVPKAVASAVGVREAQGRTVSEALVEDLEVKDLLLVLDNCEHLVDACAVLVDGLLRACANLKVLATSREALGVAGEIWWPVPPLSLPDPEDLPPLENLARYEAVRLFTERARAVGASFELDQKRATAVARVCNRLEGMPLAIELAAARVRVLSVEQIAARLEESFRLLKSESRTADPRHRTLRATIDWSFALLSQEEQALFRRLSVFAGGWTLEAAEAVCAGEGVEDEEVLDLLSHLVDKSLVVAEAGPEASVRYRMLEPLRQYAQDLLEEDGGAERVREQHAAYYVELAERAQLVLRGPEQLVWLEHLETEHDNFRAALGWTLERGEDELELRLAASLERFWWVGGLLSEGRHWLERGLTKGRAAPASVRAKALSEAGWMALWQDDLEKAIALLEKGLPLFRDLEDEQGVATTLTNLGHAMLHQGDRERLRAFCEEAEALRRRFVDRWAVAELLVLLGMSVLYEGDHERATELLEESMASFRELGDARRVAVCVTYLWMAALESGDHERAVAMLEEDLRQSRKLGARTQLYDDLSGLAVVAALAGQPARAVRLWGAAETLRDKVGISMLLWEHVPTDYEGRLAATRSQLGEEAYSAAWEEGRGMTPEEAIAYALKTEEPPPSSKPAAGLSERELEVLRLVAEGLTDSQVAQRLYLSPRTVGHHLSAIYRKLGVSSRAAAAKVGVEQGLI